MKLKYSWEYDKISIETVILNCFEFFNDKTNGKYFEIWLGYYDLCFIFISPDLNTRSPFLQKYLHRYLME